MELSWSSLSAGAMTAAVSLGGVAQSLGSSAIAAAQSVPAILPSALPQAVNVGTQAVSVGAQSSSTIVNDLTLVEKPMKAAAAGVGRSSLLLRSASFLTKALPIIAIGASALAGAKIVRAGGPQALIDTKTGRGAVLGAVGGTLMLIPTGVTQIAAAGALGAAAANEFGAFDRFDHAPVSVKRD